MGRPRRLLTEDERDAAAPRPWLIWRLTKANLVALVGVVVAFAVTGILVVYNGHQDEQRDDRQASERRSGICVAVVDVGPVELAKALGQDPASPDAAAALTEYRQNLYDALGFCPGPRP